MSEDKNSLTSHISAAMFKRLYQSTALANCVGMVLNTFITVSWEVVGAIDEDTNRWCHNRLLELMRKWFQNYGRALLGKPLDFACIWVRERGKKYGLHSHLLLHVYPELEYSFTKWLSKAVPRIARKAVGILPDINEGILVHQSPNRGRCTRHQWNIFRYLLKGLDPDDRLVPTTQKHLVHLASEFGQIRRLSNEGVFSGPRCGTSRQIGPAMQKIIRAALGTPDFWPENAIAGEFLPYDGQYLDWWDRNCGQKRLQLDI